MKYRIPLFKKQTGFFKKLWQWIKYGRVLDLIEPVKNSKLQLISEDGRVIESKYIGNGIYEFDVTIGQYSIFIDGNLSEDVYLFSEDHKELKNITSLLSGLYSQPLQAKQKIETVDNVLIELSK